MFLSSLRDILKSQKENEPLKGDVFMKQKNYKAIAGLMLGTLFTAGIIAACGSQSNAAPTQAITSSQELMASGAKSASVPVTPATQTAKSNDIGEEAAKKIALEHAGIAEADASYLWVGRDYDDGRHEYEVEFFSGIKEYDYDIDAVDGTILSFDSETEYAGKKAEKGTVSANQTPAAASQTPGAEISLEQAKKIALAKVPGANDSHIRIEKDRDDGLVTYEGKVVYNGVEYEFEINAADGTVLDWEIDD